MSSYTQVAHLENIVGRVTRSRLSMQGAAYLGFLDKLRRSHTQQLHPRGPTFRRSHPQVVSGEHGVEVSTHW